MMDTLPTSFTVGNRTYDMLSFLRGNEKSVYDIVIVKRAMSMNAHLGQDDGEHILKPQDQIPASLQGKVVFVFTDWRAPDGYTSVYYIHWRGDRWVRNYIWCYNVWDHDVLVLRRH